MDALSAAYWWPTMTTDAAKFVAQCQVCLSNKHSRVASQVPPGQFDPAGELRVQVVADLVRPPPVTPEGYCYLIVLVDRASRWIEAYPMKGNMAEFLLTDCLLFVWR
jgi:hypothetical protein